MAFAVVRVGGFESVSKQLACFPVRNREAAGRGSKEEFILEWLEHTVHRGNRDLLWVEP